MTMSELSQINKCSATTSQKVRPKQVFLPKVKYDQKPRLKHLIMMTLKEVSMKHYGSLY